MIESLDSSGLAHISALGSDLSQAPATAAEAIAALERAHAFWQNLLRALPAASWWEQLGPVAGAYAEADKASLVLHQLDEQIHHGAELGVLRDLYRHKRSSQATAGRA